MQPWYISHAETLTQNVVGLLISFVLLHAFGIPTTKVLAIQVTFFFTSYLRGYVIRRAFERWGYLLRRKT